MREWVYFLPSVCGQKSETLVHPKGGPPTICPFGAFIALASIHALTVRCVSSNVCGVTSCLVEAESRLSLEMDAGSSPQPAAVRPVVRLELAY
jgi:hypothetical protein